jgi:tRNA 2-thiouridine synthesizing protein A
MVTTTLDLAGLKCPLPALRTRKALGKLQIGDRLSVLCTDPLSAIDIPHLVNATGNHLIEVTRDQATITFLIEIKSI